jgi:hypothetical protein
MEGWTSQATYASRDGARLQVDELLDAVPRLYGAFPAGVDASNLSS